MADDEKYRGQEITAIYVDELAEWTEEDWAKLEDQIGDVSRFEADEDFSEEQWEYARKRTEQRANHPRARKNHLHGAPNDTEEPSED